MMTISARKSSLATKHGYHLPPVEPYERYPKTLKTREGNR